MPAHHFVQTTISAHQILAHHPVQIPMKIRVLFYIIFICTLVRRPFAVREIVNLYKE